MEAILPYLKQLLQGSGAAASVMPVTQPQQSDQSQPQQAMPANMAIPNTNLKKIGSTAMSFLGGLI